MFRLHRYIFIATGLAALSSVGLFVFVMMSGTALKDIFKLLADNQINLTLFVELFLLLIPYAVSFAMPMGVLIAILIIMGKLSANNELTAMKSAGISLWSISAPVLFVAVVGSLLSVYINAYHAPVARASYKAILNDLVRTDPLRFIVPRMFIHEFPGYVLYVAGKDNDKLEQFWLWELDDQKRATRLLRADEGYFSYDSDRDSLILILKNGYTELRSTENPDNLTEIQPTLSFGDAQIRLPLENILGEANKRRDNSQLSLNGFLKKREDLLKELQRVDNETERNKLSRDLMRSQYLMSRNFAMAFSVFSLALLGIPLGIKASRTETYANIAIALAIALTYYLTIVFVDWLEDSPEFRPDLLVWMPNLTCQLFGFFLIKKANKH